MISLKSSCVDSPRKVVSNLLNKPLSMIWGYFYTCSIRSAEGILFLTIYDFPKHVICKSIYPGTFFTHLYTFGIFLAILPYLA